MKPERKPSPVIEAKDIDSVTLRRLIKEVANEQKGPNPQMYNRIHNRHNRGGG